MRVQVDGGKSSMEDDFKQGEGRSAGAGDRRLTYRIRPVGCLWLRVGEMIATLL